MSEDFKIFQTTNWKIRVPCSWTINEDGVCVSFAPEIDDAALQISCYVKTAENVTVNTRDEAWEFCEKKVEPTEVECGNFAGHNVSFEKEDAAWRAWFLSNDHLLLFVTFNCPNWKEGIHGETVDEVLSTLQSK